MPLKIDCYDRPT